MAVSDFTPAFSFSEEQLAKTYPLLQRKKNWTIGLRKMNRQIPLFQKISSDTEHLVLVLEKHQKSFLIYVNGSQKQNHWFQNY